MHIDFAPPSNGTYNNAGSCRQLANYMEHENLERMEKGIYTEDFFNLTDDNIYKSKVIKDIDSNRINVSSDNYLKGFHSISIIYHVFVHAYHSLIGNCYKRMLFSERFFIFV